MVDIASWLSKTLLYGATAGIVGAVFMRFISEHQLDMANWLRSYSRWAAAFGMFSVLLAGTSQLVLFSGQGINSLTDGDTLTMLLSGNLGWTWGLALSGFIVCWLAGQLSQFPRIQTFIMVLGMLLIVASYWFTGHLVDADWIQHLLLISHVLTMGLWIGALLPLYKVASLSDPQYVRRVMIRFGELALIFIPILVLSGILMLLHLLGDLRLLFHSDYGQTILLKLTVVTLLLGLGALNKGVFVPRLPEPASLMQLAKSIRLEMLFATAVFGITAFATVVIGLEH